MLRCARTAFPKKIGASRIRSSSNNSNKGPAVSGITNGAAKPPPILNKAAGKSTAGEAAVDSSFKSSVIGFMLIQGVGIAFFGLAHKMENDAAFAKKMEQQYYDIPGVKPTLETFRSIVQFAMPKLKESGMIKPKPTGGASESAQLAPAAVPVPAASAPKMESEAVKEDEVVQQQEVEEVVVVEEEAPVPTAVPETPTESEPEPVLLMTEETAEEEQAAAAAVADAEEEVVYQADKMTALVSEAAAVSAADAKEEGEVQTAAAAAAPVEEKMAEKPDPSLLPAVESESHARMLAVHGQAAEEALHQASASALRARADLQASLLQDLDSLSNEELRKRITQLAAEFFERTKWEGLRMHEALRHLESELGDKYGELMREQRAQLQAELDRALVVHEKELMAAVNHDLADISRIKEEAVANAVQAQAAGFHLSVQKQLSEERESMHQQFEDHYNAQLATMKHAQVQELVRITDDLQAVRADVDSFESVVDTVNANQKASRELHLQTAAILALQDVLATSTPLGPVVPALKKRCADNELIVSALDTLSAHGQRMGIPTAAELRLRFKVVRKEVRKASLIPEFAPNFLGQAVGSALAAISWRPAEGSKVDRSTIGGNDVEDQLASVAYYLDLNDLPSALKEANHIKGYPRMLMADWESAAKDRMAADQVVSVLKSEMALKHQQMSKI